MEKDLLEPEIGDQLVALGPRREPLPFADTAAPDWVQQAVVAADVSTDVAAGAEVTEPPAAA